MGTVRFSPGFRVKRTAMAPPRCSPPLTQDRSLLDEPSVRRKRLPNLAAVSCVELLPSESVRKVV